jgi:catechol 2,3-dioxygenase-like lactoylglutathione lyase family enzyme
MSAGTVPSVHHVVLCVRPDNLDDAAALWRTMGYEFIEVDLVEEGLRVLLDWDRGIELLTPTSTGGSLSEQFRSFLDERGEGVWSVVVRVADVDATLSSLDAHGVQVRYLQRRDLGGARLDEADLAPVHGMPITLLATDLP